jgi:hypothetical protein
MASGRGEHTHRDGVGTLEHVRQVAHHATGSFSQGQLDRPVQLADDVAEPARYLKDHYLTGGTYRGRYLPTPGRQRC